MTLHRRDDQWFASLVVERKGPKAQSSIVVGVDSGMVSIGSSSEGRRYGQVSPELRRRKQQLNACLKGKDQPTVSLNDDQVEALARNQIGRALNPMLDELPGGSKVALERLTVKGHALQVQADGLGLARFAVGDKRKFKLEERSIGYRSLPPAYASQQCSQCGFTLPMNRRSQAEFDCLWCGFKANADQNAAQGIAERFGDDALNRLSFRDVETVLAIRFMRRLPDAVRCPASPVSAGLELQPAIWLPRGKGVVDLEPLPTVNQPGQHPCHTCPGIFRDRCL